MLRYDNHVHLNDFGVSPDQFIEKLEQAGMTGSNVFSIPPVGFSVNRKTAEYEDRIRCVLEFTAPYPDRLFPILWIHPDEDGILEKIEDAAGRGIKGFKMICTNYYVYEDKAMRVLEKIASVHKPVIFHTGILWDGMVTSYYNKPLNWECCLNVRGLKFALAHCSWPWYDECIALYGKFLSAYTKRRGDCSEIFLDLSPGTPMPYRRDLLTKLHTVGYDVKHNLLFGSDFSAQAYNVDSCREWMKVDDAIYADLGLDEETLSFIYGENLKRFLGLEHKEFIRKVVLPDGSIGEVEM